MKFLAVVPARGGSKRLPGKNLKSLGGQPLIAWTIQTAHESGVCADVFVSTDDLETARVARQYGAIVPSLRPPNLATDTASSVDVVLHVLNEYEGLYGSIDGLILLQPTSPFRTANMIRRGVQQFEGNSGRHSVVSVSNVTQHPEWCFYVRDGHSMEPFVNWAGVGKRSQDLEPVYALDGALYIVTPMQLRSESSFVNKNSVAIMTSDWREGIDIDTERDWFMAEAALKSRL